MPAQTTDAFQGHRVNKDMPRDQGEKVPETELVSNETQDTPDKYQITPRSASAHGRQRKDSLSECESGDEDMALFEKRKQDSANLSSDIWLIQKLIKHIRTGNQTVTVIAIASLRDCDLSQEVNQLAIRDLGGLEMIVNILETNDIRCVRAALSILNDLCGNVWIRSAMFQMNAIEPLVTLLDHRHLDVRIMAAEVLSLCAKNVRNRRAIRTLNGLPKLVRLLRNKDDNAAKSAAMAIWSCCFSERNVVILESLGFAHIIASRLVISKNIALLSALFGVMQKVVEYPKYKALIRELDLVPFFIDTIKQQVDHILLTHCTNCIFRSAEDAEIRKLVKQCSGLAPIVNLLDTYQKSYNNEPKKQELEKELSSSLRINVPPKNQKENEEVISRDFLAAITGAIWKLSLDSDNISDILQLSVVKKLSAIMESSLVSEKVLTHVVGALGACANSPAARPSLREGQTIRNIILLFNKNEPELLKNAAIAIGACAQDKDCLAIIDKNDGVRLLWSLLKSPFPAVQAGAAIAIRPCIDSAKDAGEMVRSFVGGLELLVSLLKSEDTAVLSGVCAALATIAKDEENLGVMTDHGIVTMLAKLTNTKDDSLRCTLSEAIAQCCSWGKNRVQFGKVEAVGPLVKFLKSSDPIVHRQTALALQQLSIDNHNCYMMHESGAVPLLMDMVGSKDEILQEAAAATLSNIRKVALENDRRKK